MYTRCIWCAADLGRNEVVESFPVGRRLAFDAAKGRLWVVCRGCERWNLTPLEERWEAIERCEQLFRDTRTRVSTDQIGLAQLREGLELVRIGAPQRPEFAAWRYGDQFGRRFRRTALWTGAGVTALAGYFALDIGLGVATGGATFIGQIPNLINLVRMQMVVARVPDAAGTEHRIRRVDLARVQLYRDAGDVLRMGATSKERQLGGWQEFRASLGAAAPTVTLELAGEPARVAAARLLPHINASGGRRSQVHEAVALIERHGDAEAAAHRLVSKGGIPGGESRVLARQPAPVRLALEMALHEAQERAWLETELSVLAERWQQAEEIAAIADGMTLPSGVESQFEQLRGARESGRAAPPEQGA